MKIFSFNFVFVQQKKYDFTYDSEESDMLQDLVKLLEPLEELSGLFCTQTSPISVKYPFAKMTEKKLENMTFVDEDVKEFRNNVLNGIRTKLFGFANER
jgi:hypothetical protein